VNIHLLHKRQTDKPQGPLEQIDATTDTWKSGYWAIGKSTADTCIGGSIFFHDRQAAPSYLGGEITGFEFVPYESKDRVLFTFRRMPSHEGIIQTEGWYREKAIRTADGDEWADEEIEACVEAYLRMLRADEADTKINKAAIYRDLEARFGRRNKAYERRMMNISYVVSELGGTPARGLQPQGNIGANESRIRKALKDQGFEDYSGPISSPTTCETDPVQLEVRTSQIVEQWSKQRRKINPPSGLTSPLRKKAESTVYERSPEVKAWVLKASDFRCESCGTDAPFSKDDGQPFLEVHHVVQLADGGPDIVENAVALCPNCHRALHYASDKDDRIEALYLRVSRLKRP
jgi:5-methylcytosine-specific restriction protein A